MFDRLKIISLDVDHLSFTNSVDHVIACAINRMSSYVCFVNVHSVIEAHVNTDFKDHLAKADIVNADGKPVAIACQLLHRKKQERISGPDFIPAVLEAANEKNLSVFFYGSTPEVLKAIENKVNRNYPAVRFAGAISPPFRTLSGGEIENDIKLINESGAHIVFIALGCPKQEKWMSTHSNKINGVLLGVGAALPIAAGLQKRAPKWMQDLALEWLYRLSQQPRRLFTRYFYTNLYFLLLLGAEYAKTFFENTLRAGKKVPSGTES